MSFIKTLINGEQDLFKPDSLTPMQKLTLRFVVVGLIYFGFVVIEGMLMRMYEVKPLPFITEPQFFAILTAHPLVGIFGSTYLYCFWSISFPGSFPDEKTFMELLNWQTGLSYLISAGTFIFWFAGFVSHYAPLYTLYWPLPADFTQFSVWGGTFFIVGIALVMVGTALFVINIFKTIVYTPDGWEKQPSKALLGFCSWNNRIQKPFYKKQRRNILFHSLLLLLPEEVLMLH